MKTRPITDTFNIGIIVPLPNHYDSDMPQGAWSCSKQKSGSSFLFKPNQGFLKFHRLNQ